MPISLTQKIEGRDFDSHDDFKNELEELLGEETTDSTSQKTALENAVKLINQRLAQVTREVVGEALVVAVTQGNPKLVSMLVKNGPTEEKISEAFGTVIYMEDRKLSQRMAYLLLPHIAVGSDVAQDVFDQALSNGRFDIIKMMETRKWPVSKFTQTHFSSRSIDEEDGYNFAMRQLRAGFDLDLDDLKVGINFLNRLFTGALTQNDFPGLQEILKADVNKTLSFRHC